MTEKETGIGYVLIKLISTGPLFGHGVLEDTHRFPHSHLPKPGEKVYIKGDTSRFRKGQRVFTTRLDLNPDRLEHSAYLWYAEAHWLSATRELVWIASPEASWGVTPDGRRVIWEKPLSKILKARGAQLGTWVYLDLRPNLDCETQGEFPLFASKISYSQLPPGELERRRQLRAQKAEEGKVIPLKEVG